MERAYLGVEGGIAQLDSLCVEVAPVEVGEGEAAVLPGQRCLDNAQHNMDRDVDGCD